MGVLHVYFHGGWMRDRGELVVMLHGWEIVVEQCLWCMVEWMTFWMDVLHVVSDGGYEGDGVGTHVMFCAPEDAILCSLYGIKGLLVGALLWPMVAHYFPSKYFGMQLAKTTWHFYFCC
jgi:hypothetical protein